MIRYRGKLIELDTKTEDNYDVEMNWNEKRNDIGSYEATVPQDHGGGECCGRGPCFHPR